MDFLNENCYRNIIKNEINRRKKWGVKLKLEDLANACGVRRPYISKVLSGNADFNFEQLYLASEFLEFDEMKSNYVQLLLRHERSANHKYKDHLKVEIEKFREKNLLDKENLDIQESKDDTKNLAEYYLDPHIQLVHIFLGIDKYKKDPSKIANVLNITSDNLNRIISYLDREGYVEINDESVEVVKKSIHLPIDSPLCLPHQLLVRLKGLEKIQRTSINETKRFSITFSSDEKTKDLINTKFVEFINEIRPIVTESSAKQVYQLNFDLFSWE